MNKWIDIYNDVSTSKIGDVGYLVETLNTSNGVRLFSIRDRPLRTNQSREPRLYDWCGETDNKSRYARGAWKIVRLNRACDRAQIVRLEGEELAQLSPDQRRLVLQVDENHYLLSDVEGWADWVNHCCKPNAGLRGQVTLVAMRDIEPGEEICYDYAMSDGSAYDGFECRCERVGCRGRVSGDDWMLAEMKFQLLQARSDFRPDGGSQA